MIAGKNFVWGALSMTSISSARLIMRQSAQRFNFKNSIRDTKNKLFTNYDQKQSRPYCYRLSQWKL